jgi:alkylation response protein AidB-like acyl-CoA dehydrogenase
VIDLRLDEEQLQIQESLRSFASEKIRPAAHDADESGRVPDALVSQAWELGLVQGSIPEQYGGYGQSASAVTGTVIAEAMAEGDLAFALHALSPRLVIDPVLHLGSEEQKKEILPLYCGDRFVAGSAAVSEPRWNFSVTALETSARKGADGWVLAGKKCLVPLAEDAPYMVAYARDENGTIGAFLIKAGTPGVEISEREKNLGLRALPTYEVTFADCRLPASARLGDDATPMLRRARVAQSAMAVGVAKASLGYAIDYAKDRDAFGVKIAQKQAIAFMLADMAIEVDAMRLLNWEAAWNLDQGNEAVREVALARQYVADGVMTVTDNGVQVLGGHGFIREHPVELWARNGRGFATFEGLASV